jgi:transcriptional regulator with XRE-family HTH domain
MTLKVPVSGDETTVSADLLADRAGFLRNRARILGADVAGVQHEVADFHRSTIGPAIRAKAVEVAKRPLADLLQELADLGFSWRAIAELCEVSVPALRKWRIGTSEPARTNRQRLAELVAVSELLTADHLIDDVAAWLEMPLDANSVVTAFDLLRQHRDDCVVELAGAHRAPADVLDEVDPEWRSRRIQFEVVEGPDGEHLIRPTSDAGTQ